MSINQSDNNEDLTVKAFVTVSSFLKKKEIHRFSEDKKDMYRTFSIHGGWETMTKETLDNKFIDEFSTDFKETLFGDKFTSKGDIVDYPALTEKEYWQRMSNTKFANSNHNTDKRVLHKIDVETRYWCKTDKAFTDDIDTSNLDALLSSVCGHTQENIEHLERWLLCKLFNPKSAFLMPSIIIYGGGSTGKGLLQSMIATMLHGRTSCEEMDITDLSNFTGKLLDASVVIFNENSSNHGNEADLKRIIGSEYVTVNIKNIPQFTIPNNISYLFTTNDPKGSVRLSANDGVNRRFGVIRTAKTALKNTELIANDVKSRAIVQNFISKLVLKHGEVMSIDALHGEDFHQLKNNQLSDDVKGSAVRIAKAMPLGSAVKHDVFRKYLMYVDVEELDNTLKDASYYNNMINDIVVSIDGFDQVNKGKAVRCGGERTRNLLAPTGVKPIKLLTSADLQKLDAPSSAVDQNPSTIAKQRWEAKKCS